MSQPPNPSCGRACVYCPYIATGADSTACFTYIVFLKKPPNQNLFSYPRMHSLKFRALADPEVLPAVQPVMVIPCQESAARQDEQRHR